MSQSDTINIEVIDIVADATKVENAFASSKEAMFYETTTLSNWLNEQSNVYVKSYGQGSLATLSIRGGNANQNLLRWNDIPINNPMLGLTDISLVPFSAFEDIEFEKGGLSSKYGSGAITGTLNLVNKKPNNSKLFLSSTIGSFGRHQFVAGGDIRNQKFSSSTKLFLEDSKNDFTYKIGNLDEKKLSNASIKSIGLSQTINYDLDKYSSLQLNAWIQRTDREIPPVTTQTNNVAFQNDELNRFALAYNRIMPKGYYKSNIAYLNETNNYTDSLANIDTNNHFEKIYHRSNFKHLLYSDQKNNNVAFYLEFEGSIIKADTEFYTENKAQYIGALIGGIELESKKSLFQIRGRKEWNNISKTSFSPSASWNYSWNKRYVTSIKLSREFRSPTLNEILWRPGGNSNLKPEEGWNQEVKAIYNIPQKGSVSIASYHRVINNWILWSRTNSTFVQANNLNKVRSYGLELEADYKIKGSLFDQQINGSYAYTISKNLVTLTQPIIEAGSQLIYTPKYKAILDYSVEKWDYRFHINYGYTSSVFGINENLDGYHIVNIGLGKEIFINRIKLHGLFQIQNVMNENYRVIERRPMPRRHFTITIKISINK